MNKLSLLGLSAAGLVALAGLARAQDDPAALAEAARCSACHHATDKRLGPSWAAVRDRYAAEEGAADTLKARVRSGGSGVWGKAPMPPVPEGQLSDADLDAVLAWILEG
ncbi:MAG: c-type cytochrome [Halieaceae bacterium]|jgi:cytochrome c|nr:c-type cytochrome [Halieaceae bacterium]